MRSLFEESFQNFPFFEEKIEMSNVLKRQYRHDQHGMESEW